MVKFEELIRQFCPDGVEYFSLSELGSLTRGKRFVHADSVKEGIPCIHYGELYTYYGISTFKTKSFVRNDLVSKLRFAQKNDVIIVGAGENDIDIGIAVAYLGEEQVAVHDACYIFRQENDPKYISYCLRTTNYHNQIKKYVSTGKICAISAEGIGKARIPVPPLPVQQEIVRILDHFTELTAELQKQLAAELFARKKQYEVYSQCLLNRFEGSLYKLGEIATIKTGRKPDEVFLNSTDYEYINAGTTNSGFVTAANCEGDTTTTPSRGQGGIGFVGFQKKAFWLGPLCYRIKSTDTSVVTNRYIYYYLKCFPELILQYRKEGGTPSVNASDLINIAIETPSMDKQNRIVSILDHFESVCNDLSSGIPAEIAARQKQYEYYRDKLLTFKELKKS